jgi:hypothetical protein
VFEGLLTSVMIRMKTVASNVNVIQFFMVWPNVGSDLMNDQPVGLLDRSLRRQSQGRPAAQHVPGFSRVR